MTLRLDDLLDTPGPRARVLILHGGQERNTEPVQDKHASWWRMALMGRSLRGWAGRQDLSLHLLQYELRGWNDPRDPSPVGDARWALEQLADRDHDGRATPIVLVGHSMGGRTACHVADHPGVLGVVGLAPWLPQGESVTAIRDRSLHVIHGTRDKWTSARWSRDYVERARPIAVEATWTSLPKAGHFMFRSIPTWNGFVRDHVERILTVGAASGTR